VITSRDNERLKRARKLLGARKHREQSGLFACEGEDLVDAARGAGIEPVDRLAAGENVAPELLASVSTLPHPARVIGVYARAALPRDPRSVCLALWRIRDPGNVGTLLRTADAFGACVALSEECADPLSPKAVRGSAGAIFRVPLVPWSTLPARRIALVSNGGQALGDVDLTPPLALLLGSERHGLPDDLATASCSATIPLPGGAESLNVAAAGAIALYELSRRASGP
jgi:RNA methyltransferase, TrmH family